ncbi:hypothetical protein ACOME3_006723 [Neoechinorhynchus agilis]
MLDLIDRTHSVQYEAFRKRRLCDRLGVTSQKSLSGDQNDVVARLMDAYSERRSSQRKEMADEEEKLKREFIDKVKSKEAELKELERQILNELVEVKQWYREQKEALEHEWNELNAEIANVNGAAKKASNTITGAPCASNGSTLSSIKVGGGHGPFGRKKK